MRWIFLILLLLNGVLYVWFAQEQLQRERAEARMQPDHTGLAPLVRLSEVPPGRLQPRAVAPSPAAKPAPGPAAEVYTAPPVPTACYRVGLFADMPAAEAFLETLGDLPVGARVTPERRALEPDYWVYVKTPSSPREVTQLQRTLKVDGLDSDVIQEGALAGELSVGVYRSQDPAQALLTALLAKEYPAEIYLKLRWEQVYSIDINTENPQQWEAYWERLRGAGSPELKNEKKSCTRVAT